MEDSSNFTRRSCRFCWLDARRPGGSDRRDGGDAVGEYAFAPDTDHRRRRAGRIGPPGDTRSTRNGGRRAGSPGTGRRRRRRTGRGARPARGCRLLRHRPSRRGVPCRMGRARPRSLPGGQRRRVAQRPRGGREGSWRAFGATLGRLRQQPRGLWAARPPARHRKHAAPPAATCSRSSYPIDLQNLSLLRRAAPPPWGESRPKAPRSDPKPWNNAVPVG